MSWVCFKRPPGVTQDFPRPPALSDKSRTASELSGGGSTGLL